jgi:AraC family transcriptional regulator
MPITAQQESSGASPGSWLVKPSPFDYGRFEWSDATFEFARRPFTREVEGVIAPRHHLLMVTLRGGAKLHEYSTDGGTRYAGCDRPASVSFLPAGCHRRLRLRDVAWEWAAIALPPDRTPAFRTSDGMRPFQEGHDAFIHGVLGEMHRLVVTDGGLDVAYADTMRLALIHYIARRYLAGRPVQPTYRGGLTIRQVRQIAEHVAARLNRPICIAELAELTGLSDGHFHRAFRQATGETPLAFVTRMRVERAADLLARGDRSVLEAAREVGFASPSHFARVFRKVRGIAPAEHRRAR